MDSSRHNNRVKVIAGKLSINENRVNPVIDLLYESIRVKLDKVDFNKSKTLSEVEFKEQFKSVIVPNIGTFVPSYKKYMNIRKNIDSKKSKE